MKKVLLGLLALSAAAMAAAPDLGAKPMAGKNVFQGGQEGAISVTGTLTTVVPEVKYVIYASKDDGATKEDTLELPPFLVRGDNPGFIDATPKVYVKRVTGEAGAEDYSSLLDSDVVKFALTGFSRGEADNQTTGWIGADNNKIILNPVGLLGSTKVKELIAATGIDAHIDSINGIVLNDGSSLAWLPEKNVIFHQVRTGELEVRTNQATYANEWNSENTAKMDAQFASGVAFTDILKIMAKVE